MVNILGKIIAVANQKGGVGKTTTAVNLSAGLALLGRRVLLIDCDPQGNATSGLGIDKNSLEQSIYDVIILDIDEGIREVYGLLRICTEIYVPVPNTEDVQAKAKLQQFEEELHLLGYDDVRRKIVKKELKR